MGLPADIVQRHPFPGPGLAIRIICGDEPYQGSDFAETNIILGQIVDFVTAIKKVSRLRIRIVCINLEGFSAWSSYGRPKVCSREKHSVCIFFIHILYGADKVDLCNNQELLQLAIIYFILVTFMCDSGVIL